MEKNRQLVGVLLGEAYTAEKAKQIADIYSHCPYSIGLLKCRVHGNWRLFPAPGSPLVVGVGCRAPRADLRSQEGRGLLHPGD